MSLETITDSIYFGGRKIPMIQIKPKHIDLRAGAEALANIGRFHGHTNCGPYSVAQHCVMVSQISFHLSRSLACDDRRRLAALWGLLHDWHESVVGDIATPLKRRMRRETDIIDRIATTVDHALCLHLGLPWPLPQWLLTLVDQADKIAYATEIRDVTNVTASDTNEAPWPTPIFVLPWHRAMDSWWERYVSLSGPMSINVVGRR